MKTNTGKEACFAAIGSVTQAQKAQRALSASAIQSTVIKTEVSSLRRGCIYGVAFPCIQRNNAEAVLSSAAVAVKEWGVRNDIF